MEVDKRLASRVNRLTESKTLKMARLSRELKDKGVDIISLSLGEPDFDTPQFIQEAAIDAMKQGFTHYPPVAGYPDLREAIAKRYREVGMQVSAANTLVSTGAKHSLANLIMSLIDFDDEVLIPAPFWVTYPEQVALAGGIVKTVNAGVAQDYKVSAQQLDEALSEKTRMIIFSSPSNPTGSVYTEAELSEMADVFRKYPNLIIVSDEIYELINFTGKHHSISVHKDLHERLVIINGVSKGYAMTGWRIGYMVAPEWIIKACEKMQGQFTSGANSIAMKAAKAALEGSDESVKLMLAEFKKRRDFLLDALAAEPRLKMNKPEGAFYLFIDVSDFFGLSDGETTIHTGEDLIMFLLDKAHVSMVEGDAFGAAECIRISYAASMEQLTEAANRILQALQKLK
ncbi:aminotransferase class I/II-fold pyridoxal phosphate-dependent enzyme [bacterium]|nr:aminotransferase class I/II-fold pyridoxal phosphate-dependent enzyme [bacterium]